MEFIYRTSSRSDGNMSLSYGDTRGSLENRKAFLEKLGLDYRRLVCAKQTHSANLRYVTEKDSGRGAVDYRTAIEDSDGFITDKKDLALAIFTADCLSISLYDPAGPNIGLVHAGWRGTAKQIAAKAVRLMQERFGARAEGLKVNFGPALRSCCYEVEAGWADTFPGAVAKRGGRYYFDLALVNTRQLLECGVRQENISDCKICTACRNDDFFSFRREGDACGRMIVVAVLKG